MYEEIVVINLEWYDNNICIKFIKIIVIKVDGYKCECCWNYFI